MKQVVLRLREAYSKSRQQSDVRIFLRAVTSGTTLQAIKDVSFDALNL